MKPYFCLFLAVVCSAASAPAKKKATSPEGFERTVRPFLARHCNSCHNNKLKTGDISLEFLDTKAASSDIALWDEVTLKLRSGQMPPAGLPRPTDAEVQPVLRWIDRELDRRAAVAPIDPGRVTVRRLNRAEYNQTIQDLFGIPIRPADEFPADDSGYGFDNIGDVLSIPPLLMESYMKAAEQVAATVIPLGAARKPALERHLADNLEQSRRVEYDDPAGYPYPPGAFEAKHMFPVDAEYDLVLRIKDRRKDKRPLVPLNFYFDGKEIGAYQVQDGEYEQGNFVVRQFVTAGEHTLYSAFPKEYVNKEEWDEKQFGKALFKMERRIYVDQFEIQGPYNYDPRKTSAWERVFVCREQTDECARRIIGIQARHAFRRPVETAEVNRLVRLVSLAKENGDSFETGIQLALKAILVSPNFLFRIERDPNPSQIHRISDLELVSRLSYFLWSSTPDEELLKLGENGLLHEPQTLEAQVRRMLKDGRSQALVKNFAGQWLQLRNLDKVNPDPDLFPKFNDYLRRSMTAETEAYFTFVMREDRSILEFLDSNYTFLNARLAQHYGIAGVEGPELRRVELTSNDRGGILSQAAVLTVSSYPTRTSPVLRGLWVLENLLGAPPPPPPAGVPPLDEKIGLNLPLRKQLEQHRANPSCAVCHMRMDAIGFGLENYDPVGSWRTQDGKFPVDSSGTLPGGKAFEGPGQLKKVLAGDKDAFTRTLGGKMLTFALGRGLERSDRPAVQLIARNVAANGYRFTSLVSEIVKSAPFQMRKGEGGNK